MRWLRRLWYDDSGQDTLEYALIVALIVGAAVKGPSAIGSIFERITDALNNLD